MTSYNVSKVSVTEVVASSATDVIAALSWTEAWECLVFCNDDAILALIFFFLRPNRFARCFGMTFIEPIASADESWFVFGIARMGSLMNTGVLAFAWAPEFGQFQSFSLCDFSTSMQQFAWSQ